MASQEQVLQVVAACIADLNAQLPADQQLSDSPNAILLGEGGTLDSLSLVNLMVSLEEALSAVLGRTVGLLDAALSQEEGLATRGQLVDFIVSQGTE